MEWLWPQTILVSLLYSAVPGEKVQFSSRFGVIRRPLSLGLHNIIFHALPIA